MEYNTSRKNLIFPEYGRNIQKLVDHALTITDPEERNNVIKAIIAIMGNMNPHLRDVSDFKHKLWDHLAIMADFKLEIDSPYPTPKKEELYQKPKAVKYNTSEIKYRHFGRIIEQLIAKAVEIEDEGRKNALIRTITNHMKKSYLMWNKEVVTDEIIFEALKDLSNGKLIPTNDLKLTDSREIMAKNRKRTIVPKKKIVRNNNSPAK